MGKSGMWFLTRPQSTLLIESKFMSISSTAFLMTYHLFRRVYLPSLIQLHKMWSTTEQ